jgi:hypothetical protein
VREVRGIARAPLVSAHVQVPSKGESQGVAAVRLRRPRPRVIERIGPRPDMIAAWAVVLGVVLLIVAILSAHS